MSISIISAVAKNGIIGVKNGLPWKLSGDLKYFSKITTGKIVLMGRNTFLSIVNVLGKPLPNRRNLVLSGKKDEIAGAEVLNNWEKVLSLAKTDEIFVIGGASVYKQALPYADKLYITEVDCSPVGDASFPEFDKNDWNLISEEKHKKDEKNEYDYSFKVYEKKK
ncbi:MAG: dihydrofolate reductase [Candidatus Paceibacterota bacterium]|jgi:dihydrofolate reductase